MEFPYISMFNATCANLTLWFHVI